MNTFNSRNEFYKKPFGAVKENSEITFRIAVDKNSPAPSFCVRKDGEAARFIPMIYENEQDGKNIFTVLFVPKACGLYFYCFALGYDNLCVYNMGKGNGGIFAQGEWFLQTVYSKDFYTPQKFKGGVLYQIFPDRFYESHEKNRLAFSDRFYRKDKDGQPYFYPTELPGGYLNKDYYGGDLKGIEEKLPYIKSLGINIIYLNPIFEAHSNHRYNTADYKKIDPDLGTLQDFKSLCANAKALDISIILDGVFSHTGSDSIYFNKEGRYGNGGAYRDQNSPFRSWYDFDPKYKCGYRAWWGFESLPEVKEENQDYMEYICGKGGVIDFWLQNGADGFRLDVADELPDNFIYKLREAVKRNGREKLLIGEVWEDAVTKISFDKRRTYLLGQGLDSVMNYPFRLAVLTFIRDGGGDEFCESILKICENYPKEALDTAWNNLSTHDTTRAITWLCGENPESTDRYWQDGRILSPDQYEKAEKRLVCAYALLFFLPGVPCIYYGDEIGMQGYRDPFNRGYFKWWHQNTFIQDSIKTLSTFRNENPIFANGGIYFVHSSKDFIAFVRYENSKEVLMAVNRGEFESKFTYKNKTYTVSPCDFVMDTIS